MSFQQGNKVTIKATGVHGIVACVYPDGMVDVDMTDGPDEGEIGEFEPEQLRHQGG